MGTQVLVLSFGMLIACDVITVRIVAPVPFYCDSVAASFSSRLVVVAASLCVVVPRFRFHGLRPWLLVLSDSLVWTKRVHGSFMRLTWSDNFKYLWGITVKVLQIAAAFDLRGSTLKSLLGFVSTQYCEVLSCAVPAYCPLKAVGVLVAHVVAATIPGTFVDRLVTLCTPLACLWVPEAACLGRGIDGGEARPLWFEEGFHLLPDVNHCPFPKFVALDRCFVAGSPLGQKCGTSSITGSFCANFPCYTTTSHNLLLGVLLDFVTPS